MSHIQRIEAAKRQAKGDTVFVVTFRGKRSRPLATREAAQEFADDLANMGIVGVIREYAAELFTVEG